MTPEEERARKIIEFVKQNFPSYYVWDKKEFTYYANLFVNYFTENEPKVADAIRYGLVARPHIHASHCQNVRDFHLEDCTQWTDQGFDIGYPEGYPSR